jgi:gliding motility-associated-like protein
MFSNCNVKEIHMSVYNRWGDRIYESKGTKPGWDGTFRQNHADPGVYMVAVRYVLINESNEKQEGTLLQNVALIR